MKYLLPLAFCLLLATAGYAHAQGDASTGGQMSNQQDEATAPAGGETDAAGTADEASAEEKPKTDSEQLKSLAEDYKEQLSEEMPSTEEMKSLADKYNIKPPSADDVRNFATQHQGQVNKALDYAKQFQEFRKEQAQDNQTGSMAPE